MAPVKEALTAAAWTPEALQTMASIAKESPFAQEQSIAEMMGGTELHRYVRGEQAALVALHFARYQGGMACHVTGCTSTGKAPLQTRQLMSSIESVAIARGAVTLTLCTRHVAIARGAKRWGGEITGAIIRKNLGDPHGR